MQKAESKQVEMQKQLAADLLGGPQGLKRWKYRSATDKKLAEHLRKVDFSCVELNDVTFFSGSLCDFQESIFDSSTLINAFLGHCSLRGCSFRNAIMSAANLSESDAFGADFTGAFLKDANLSGANLIATRFPGANLTNANLSNADICRADLADAVLTDVTFTNTRFDEQTKWPPGFKHPADLVFCDTLNDKAPNALPAPGTSQSEMDFREFVSFIETELPVARADKAITMLKAESFQLFVEVNDDSITGIVKSQTNWELVYSCLLSRTGDYTCCTQNLRRCGGLMAGSLCKHILVLILGLAQSKQLDTRDVCQWILASKDKKTSIDKEKMSTAFLRYKGAEAGELDWRPMETVPEDYYTF